MDNAKTIYDVLSEYVPVLLALISLVHSIYAAGRTREVAKRQKDEEANRKNGA